jgi:hypothetical protein
MWKPHFFLSILSILSCLLIFSCGSSDGSSSGEIEDFPIEKLSGKWEDIGKENAFYEVWQPVNKDSLSGKGFVLIQQDTVFIEKLALWKDHGKCKYSALVSNQNGGERIIFTETSAQNGRIIFENPTHEFPQRIIYELISNVEMHVLIDGNQNGQYHKQHFSYIRK